MPEAAGAAPFALSARRLRAAYGDSVVLHDIDFAVGCGEVVALLGRNGAGKSTTLKCLIGLVEARTGSVLLDGVEIVSEPPERIARRGLAYCPEERGIFASLSVEENLILPPVIADGGLALE